jgi:hypothetical protein
MKPMVLVLWITFSSFADFKWICLSPAIRLGYEFGDSKGFVLGIGCGVFYNSFYPIGQEVSINTFTQYSFARKTLSQASDLSAGLVDLFFASLGEEISYGKGSFEPFYQFSVSAFGIDGITYKKYFDHNWHDLFLQAGAPIPLWQEGEFLQLNLSGWGQ